MRKLILLTALLLPSLALAQQWEYKVVSLGIPMDTGGMTPKPKGGAIQAEGSYHTIPAISAALNELGAQGWEVVGVAGTTLAQTVILKRPITTPE